MSYVNGFSTSWLTIEIVEPKVKDLELLDLDVESNAVT